jgi:uncharacterized protein
MPEYLSPGVYIEEIPSGIQAIEGVSTSTAGFVGRARRGTVPGYLWPGTGNNLPFTPDSGFVLTPDPAPILVTSFAEFQREFGPPLPVPTATDPTDYGFLGWAVRAFFDQGGKRVYVARIADPNDKPSLTRVDQGVVYRLLRSASKTDKTVFLTSTRGLNIGDKITFTRHSDGKNALGTADQAAIADGGPATFALNSGDSIKVTAGAGVPVSGTWTGTPASVVSAAAANFPGLLTQVLQMRVGPLPASLQTITFTAGDPITPLSNPPLLAEVVAYISRFATGVHVFANASNEVQIETDLAGTGAQLTISGTAVATLGFGAVTAGGGNVADIAHVTIAEIAAQLPSGPAPNDFTVADNGAGALRIASVATGAAAKIQLDENNPGALGRLGYAAVPTVSNGVNGVSPSIGIVSWDSQSNSVTFAAPLGVALDSGDVYGIVTASALAPVANAGPQFFGRSPGAWSAGVQVWIVNSDRSAVPIVGSGTIATGAVNLKVQNVSSFYVGAAVEIDYSGASRSNHEIVKIDSGTSQITLGTPTTLPINPAAAVKPIIRTLEIDVTVIDTTGAAPTETYKSLSWNQSANADVRRHYAWVINANSGLVWVQPPKVGTPALAGGVNEDFHLPSQPTSPDGFPMAPQVVGSETLIDNDDTWVGVDNGPGQRSGIEALIDLSDIAIIAAPGKTSPEIQLALIDQCELLRFRFAVLDGERDPKAGSVTSILAHAGLYDTSFAAYYQPWITVTIDGQLRYLPPAGYMAGVYARVDDSRGVWKAPANEPVFNLAALKTYFVTGEQDVLNPRGVNLIRKFEIGGIRVWGARTLSTDTDLKYINVRRTLIFIEHSLDNGTQWVVFEPNTPVTWARVTDSVSAFLLTQWRSGALFGRKPEQAFFVRCDETTMTADDILNGRLICEIGVAIVRPAEFVIFRIQQITNFGAAQ